MPDDGPPRVPARLNLAIGRRCFVHCAGCYTYFGRDEPSLDRLERSIAAFVGLGVDSVTVAGGDPLTVEGIAAFLARLRDLGVRSIKLDTVGSNLIEPDGGPAASGRYRATDLLAPVLAAVDVIALPLDGWSNESALRFRRGRPRIHDETVALLEILDDLRPRPTVVINSVAHRHNIRYLDRIGSEVARHTSIDQWNVFQYTATDQATDDVNRDLGLPAARFRLEAERLTERPDLPAPHQRLECWSSASRLGQYLLINSDLEAWIPDTLGRTVRLASIVGREAEVLERWRAVVAGLDRPEPSHVYHLDN